MRDPTPGLLVAMAPLLSTPLVGPGDAAAATGVTLTAFGLLLVAVVVWETVSPHIRHRMPWPDEDPDSRTRWECRVCGDRGRWETDELDARIGATVHRYTHHRHEKQAATQVANEPVAQDDDATAHTPRV